MAELNRNNTNFPLELFEFFKNTEWSSQYDFLKYYQNIVRVYVENVNLDARGLLIYQTMGLGKSILAISIAIDMMKTRPPILLLTKSLQENMRGSIRKYVKLRLTTDPDYPLGRLSSDQLDDWIKHNFSFVSMNASNMLKQVGKATETKTQDDITLDKKFGEVLKIPSLDGKLLIVDEAHNLFRAITNGSKNALGLYDMILRAKNLRVMFFTGTPISNDPFELVPCFNMLAGNPGRTLLPESYKDFNSLFKGADRHIQNKGKFQNRIFGLVSYVNHTSTPGKALGRQSKETEVKFPEQLPIIVERVNMDYRQFTLYSLARDKEQEEGVSVRFKRSAAPPSVEAAPLTKPKSKAGSSYRVKSRQLSNFAPPADYTGDLQSLKSGASSPKYERFLENLDKHKNQPGIVYSQFIGVGGLGSLAMFLEANGWKRVGAGGPKVFTEEEISNDDSVGATAKETSSNETPPAQNVSREQIKGEHEEFISRLHSEVTMATGQNTTEDEPEDESADSFANENFTGEFSQYLINGGRDRVRTYAVISGAVSTDDRESIKQLFNRETNRDGSDVDLLLLSAAASEGVDLARTRHVHIMEPYWSWNRIEQIIARGVRNGSHVDLPPEEQRVQPYIYIAIPPEDQKKPNGEYAETSDTELYNDAVAKQITIESFLSTIKETSIECLINEEPNCRVCAPTSRKLYSGDVQRDIKDVDPCGEIKSATVRAKKIEVNGGEYWYKANPNSIYEYDIFIWDEPTASYRKLPEDDPKYADIALAISNL